MTSCKLSRRNFRYGSKVKLLENQPLPEPADSCDCAASSSDSLESCATITQSTTSRCDKDDDDLDWQHSTCDSSLLGQSSSSFMSWADDVELEMTQKMQHLWDEIDSFLYEEDSGSNSLPPEQAKECEQWKNKFPHLRVVGHRVLTKHGCDDRDSIQVPAEFEEVIASHGHCDHDSRPASACCSCDKRCKHYGGRLEEDVMRGKIVQGVKDKVFAYVWSEVAKFLSEQTFEAGQLSANTSSLTADVDSSDSTGLPHPSEHSVANTSHARRQRAHSLPRKVTLGVVRERDTNRYSAHNLPLLAARHSDTNSWKMLEQRKVSSSLRRCSEQSTRITLPPIENMQVSTKVMPCGHKSPGVFGEKLNSSTEHSYTKSTLLIAPRADWRHCETSRGYRNPVPCTKSAKSKRGISKMSIDPRNK